MTQWRVMLNSKLWNQSLYEAEWISNEKGRRIPQSKGKAKMVICPVKDDTVLFVQKGKIIMKGVIESDGFMQGNEHQIDIFNLGNVRPHAEHDEFIWVQINEIGLSEEIRKTGQRTWAKYI